ncbi:MAG: hypothetical protein H6707_21420 [Deltaproteobacteria bacterium]|nr:hypothetical protein [Deltaproteobacteria bacterium]
MIPYEELCEALERYNARRNNQHEMDALIHSETMADPAQGVGAFRGEDRQVIVGSEGALYAHGEGSFAGDPIGDAPTQHANVGEQTHEIDVEDVEVDPERH